MHGFCFKLFQTLLSEMNIGIKEIQGDVKIDGNIITIQSGCIILEDGTIIRSNDIELPQTSSNNANVPTGPILCEEFKVGSFNTLIVSSYLNIDFSIGEKPKVYIEATKDIVDNILVDNNGSELHLNVASGFDADMKQINIKVVAPRLSKIITYDSSIVNVLTPIKNKGTIMISAHEGSRITMSSIISQTVYLSTTEAAKLTLHHVEADNSIIIKTIQASKLNITENIKTNNLYATFDQASQIDIKGIKANQIMVKTAGGANIKLNGEANMAEYVAGGRSSITADELTAINGHATTTELARIRCHVTEHFEKHSSILAKISNV